MSIRQIVENRTWNELKQDWVVTAPKTHAQAVETNDGSNVQLKLDALPGQIASAKNEVIAEIRAGVAAEGDTLAKVYSVVETLKSLVNSDDVDLDTIQEIVEYIKTNRGDIDAIGTNKINFSDIINDLNTVGTVEKKALDARQGKVLKGLIDVLTMDVSTLETQAAGFATISQLENGISTAITATRPVLSETPPTNPADGQIWLKPAGIIEIQD